MPNGSALAFSVRDRDEDRAAQAADIERSVTQSLGARLAEPDAKRVHALVDDFAKARGETLGASLVWDEPHAWYVRSTVKDGDAAERAMKTAFELARASPFKEMLRAKDVAVAHEDVAGLGKAAVATMTREPHDAGALPVPPLHLLGGSAPDGGAPSKKKDVLAVAWIVEGGGLDLASGDDPLLALRGSVKPDRKLGDEPGITSAVASLGADASTIVIAQPLRFDPRRANLPTAPIVLGVGKREKAGFVRLDVADGLLREAARFLMGM
jgi:hypothetical protein